MTLPPFYAAAECREVDTWHFYPMSPRSRPSPLAVKACSRCGVREECLSFSITHPVQLGFWGGMTEEQRLAERKRRHIQRQTDQRRAGRAAARQREDEAA
jgi:WhiB family redox-sensing transcriptional regulator